MRLTAADDAPADKIALDSDVCDNVRASEDGALSSRQRRWQEKKQREGRCQICGQPATASCYCDDCHEKRKNRVRAERGEKYKPQTCSLCGKSGHNKRTCPENEARQALVETASPADA